MKKAVSWLLLFLIVLASPTQAALLARNWAFDHSLYQGKNRLTGHNDQNDNLTNDNGTAFTSNGADQLTKAGTTALAYNGAGQATSVGQLSMKFAYNDQIKSITGQGLNAAYLYDGNGQRVQKTVNGTVQNFLWNGGSIAKEYKPDGSVRADYQLGAGAKIEGKWQFYLSDIQGSTLGVTDDTGKVIATWSYSDYGVTTQTSGDKNLYQPFLYTHSELDSETGFYHNKARHYAPKFGKFLARDSIANSNLYSYCNGDPINHSDRSGMLSDSPDSPTTNAYIGNPGMAPVLSHVSVSDGIEATGWAVVVVAIGQEALGVAGLMALQRASQQGSGGTSAVTLSQFSAAENGVINEANQILASPELSQLRASAAVGESIEVSIGGRMIQYEPNLPGSGLSMFGENGFLIGPQAFNAESELGKTILHELYRLTTSNCAQGLSAGLATEETNAAANFADRAAPYLNQ